MKNIFFSLFALLMLSSCSITPSSKNSSAKFDKEIELRKKESQEIISFYYRDYAPSKKQVFNFTFCKDLIDSQEPLVACVEPIINEAYINKKGIFLDKMPEKTITLDLDGELTNFNVHSVMFENGEIYKSLSYIEQLPFQKRALSLFPVYILSILDELIVQSKETKKQYDVLFSHYQYFNKRGVLFNLIKDGDVYREKQEEFKDYYNKFLFIESYVPKRKWLEAVNLLNGLIVTQTPEGDFFLNLDSKNLVFSDEEEDFFNLSSTNLNFVFDENDNMNLFLSFFSPEIFMNLDNVKNIYFPDSNLSIDLEYGKNIFKKDDNFFINVKKEDYSLLLKTLKTNINVEIEDDNGVTKRTIHISDKSLKFFKQFILILKIINK